MTVVYVSTKGQITLPVQLRRKLGIKPKAKMEVEVRDGEIVLRPVRSIMDVKGMFRGLEMGSMEDWERIRDNIEGTIL